MSGICVAVKATTSCSGRSRNTTLKLWKSRPAAPAIRTRVLAMHKAYSVSRSESAAGAQRRLDLGENLPHAVGHGLHLQGRAGRLLQQLLGPQPLPLGPQLAQQRTGVAGREPARAELLAQIRAQLRFESPRAQVRGDVEAGVDIR